MDFTVKLPEKDPLFLDRLLIVDADTTVPQDAAARGNIVKLPNVPGTTGVARSLENTVKQFLRDISNTPEGPLHNALLGSTRLTLPATRFTSTFSKMVMAIAPSVKKPKSGGRSIWQSCKTGV